MNALIKASVIVFLFLSISLGAQSVVNGNFSSGTTGWSCSPEVNTEATYGGSGSNPVNEVDAAATLCQTISGFVIGNNYILSVDASRRTGGCPGPVVTNVDVTVSGGALAATITRNNTTFGFVTEGLPFTANSTIHTITFAAGAGFGGSTCGMIVDNISVAASVLPIELISFSGLAGENSVELHWSTATEKNNSHFEIERSSNGSDFAKIMKVASKSGSGQSLSKLDYAVKDESPFDGTVYYRLKQIDLDLSYTYSKIIAVSALKTNTGSFLIYPNPNKGTFFVTLPGVKNNTAVEIIIYNQLGKPVYSSRTDASKDLQFTLPHPLEPGYYHCRLVTENFIYNKALVIE